MKYNLWTFAAFAILITGGYIAMGNAFEHLPEGLQGVSSIANIVIFFWIFFDLIAKVIAKFVGAKPNTKFTHDQAAKAAQYWIIWLMSSVVTGTTLTWLLDPKSLVSAFVFDGVVIVITVLAYLNNKQKIMGHTKKDLFQ